MNTVRIQTVNNPGPRTRVRQVVLDTWFPLTDRDPKLCRKRAAGRQQGEGALRIEAIPMPKYQTPLI